MPNPKGSARFSRTLGKYFNRAARFCEHGRISQVSGILGEGRKRDRDVLPD